MGRMMDLGNAHDQHVVGKIGRAVRSRNGAAVPAVITV